MNTVKDPLGRRKHSSGMSRANRRTQGIGGVVGFGDLKHTQKQTDHFLDLSLVRRIFPHHRLLDGVGGKLSTGISFWARAIQRTPRASPTAIALEIFLPK